MTFLSFIPSLLAEIEVPNAQIVAEPTNYMPILLILVVFGAVACVVLAVGSIALGQQSRAELIERRMGIEQSPVGEVPLENLARDADGRYDRFFYRTLAESGLEISPLTALLMMLGLALVAAAVAWVVTEDVGIAAVAAILGFWPPLLWIMWVRQRRIAAMEVLLPGALEQMADCLVAGQTLEEATETVSIQTASPLKEELANCVRLLRMGQSPVAVMDRMSRRIPLPEFRLFATAVLVHRQTGGNLARLTSRLAVSARDRQEWRRHLGAQTVAGRYSALGLIVCGIVGVTVITSTHPEYTHAFFTEPAGPTYLAVAVALIIIGTIWIAQVIRVRY